MIIYLRKQWEKNSTIENPQIKRIKRMLQETKE
jgi:hypothetical protein